MIYDIQQWNIKNETKDFYSLFSTRKPLFFGQVNVLKRYATYKPRYIWRYLATRGRRERNRTRIHDNLYRSKRKFNFQDKLNLFLPLKQDMKICVFVLTIMVVRAMFGSIENNVTMSH